MRENANFAKHKSDRWRNLQCHPFHCRLTVCAYKAYACKDNVCMMDSNAVHFDKRLPYVAAICMMRQMYY